MALIAASLASFRTWLYRSSIWRETWPARLRGVAVVSVMHLNKGASTNVNSRINGSVDFAAAARAVLLVGVDPADPDGRVVVRAKSNLPAEPEPQGFLLADGRVEWTGPKAKVCAADLLRGESGPAGTSAADRAAEWLADQLEEGPMPSSELERLAERVGISRNSLFKAKENLGIKPKKRGMSGGWEWAMPEESRTHEERYSSKSTGRYSSENRRETPSSQKSTAWDSSKSTVSTNTGLFGESPGADELYDESEELA